MRKIGETVKANVFLFNGENVQMEHVLESCNLDDLDDVIGYACSFAGDRLEEFVEFVGKDLVS